MGPWVLISGTWNKADGPAVEDTMNLERGDDTFVCVCVRGHRGSEDPEVYLIPKARMIDDMRENHARWIATHPDSESDVRALAFSGDPATPGRGFRVHYAEFRIHPEGAADQVEAEPLQRHTDESPAELQRLMNELARRSSAYYGQPLDRIRVSVGVMFRTGELIFNWAPNASE